MEERIKTVAEMSMGTEITNDDITNIWYLCDQVATLSKNYLFFILFYFLHEYLFAQGY